jgi:hypothetical protein
LPPMLRRWPSARPPIPQAWSIDVKVNENNDTHAFKVTVGNEPLFATVKADKRAHPGDGSQRRGDAARPPL